MVQKGNISDLNLYLIEYISMFEQLMSDGLEKSILSIYRKSE